MSSTAYLGLSSKYGDRAANLVRALSALVIGDIRVGGASSIYEVVSESDEPSPLVWVVNIVAPRLEAFSLFNYCQATETRVGRKGMMEQGIKPVDIELLLLDSNIVEDVRKGVEVILPHPSLHRQRTYLMPLAEVAPAGKHPVLKETFATLLDTVEDAREVRIYRG